ncbi:MAG: protein of unknown function rane lipoprotein [Armatimonadetes bacterium]|nr:protein of unknown function rane lipoprotein [Armatimonadota bacterium]
MNASNRLASPFALGALLLSGGVLLSAPTPAQADELIQIPTADLVPGLTAEYKHRLSGNDEGYASLRFPAGLAYELDFRYYNNEDNDNGVEGGGLFQLLPDGVVTPGIALGVWDVTNSSRWGRRGFLTVTKGLQPGQLFVREPLRRLQLTFGTGTGRLSGIFAGLRADLPAHLSLIAEYDSRRFNAGIWYTPIRPFSPRSKPRR